MHNHDLELLRKARYFASLPPGAIEKIADAVQTANVDRGQLLFSKGDAADAAYVVLEGAISIEIISSDGRIARVATQRSGELFGEFAVLDDGPRTAHARALTSARLVKISKQYFFEMLAAHPTFALSILSDLVQKLRKSDVQIEHLSFRPLRVRLAALLLELASEAGGSTPTIRVTQAELGERLSATREKVNVHLQSMQRDKAIALRRGRIDFLDLDRIGEIADE